MLMLATVIVLVAGGAVFAVWLPRVLDRQLSSRNAEVDGRLEAITETMDRRLGELDTKVDRRLEHATQQTNAIHKQLGAVGQATEQLAEQAKELGAAPADPAPAEGARRVRRAPARQPPRGPAAARRRTRSSTSSRGGERVDAAIMVDRIVPIDSKFPLDNFERMVGSDNDIERQQFEKLFARDVKGHVDAIASKYIRPDEGTYDFAFMYLPVGGDLLRARLRQDGRAARVREHQARPPRLADDADRVPAGDRARAQGPSDRAARAGGHGLLRAARSRTSAASARTSSSSASTSATRRERYVDAEKRLERFGDEARAGSGISPQSCPAEAHELPRAVDAA